MFEQGLKSISEDQKLAVKSWWKSFEENEDNITDSFSADRNGKFNLPEWMQRTLQSIDSKLMWEFGQGLTKSHKLIITPESYRELRPLVHFIIQEAPEVKNFEFYEYRLPENIDEASTMMAHRTNWQDISKIKFQTSIGDLNKINIEYFTPFKEPKEEQINKLYLLTEQILGEELAEKWVGYIDVNESPKGNILGFFKKQGSQINVPMNNLKPDFEKRIEEVKSSLPQKPYCEIADDHGWVMLELKPEKQDDYEYKDDLFVAPFISETLFNAMHGGRKSFSAERFSKNGETFLFLKMDGSADDLNQEVFEDRASIEDALNDALGGQGCMIGGGTGLRYSYIDLAVTDLNAAIPIIQKTLQDGKLTKRSWLFFPDPDYQAEWIGVWPDSPEPYRE